MDTTATRISTRANTTLTRAPLRAATVCALAASGINLLLWATGRAAGASFVVDPGLGEPNLEVGGLKVVATTLLPLAAGALVLALAARRSGRWVVAVGVLGVMVALASAAGPLHGAHDTTTGVLLATMHLVTAAAFVVAAAGCRGRQQAGDGGRA